jgi:hypothetical protein
MTFEEGSGLLFREREVLGVDHCWLGVRFAEANRLPAAVVAAVRYHHAPVAETTHRRLVALTALADRLANHVQRRRKVADYTFDGCPGFAVLAADWDARRRAEVRASLPKAVVWSMRLTRGMLASAA